jgi:hypothetical protein
MAVAEHLYFTFTASSCLIDEPPLIVNSFKEKSTTEIQATSGSSITFKSPLRSFHEKWCSFVGDVNQCCNVTHVTRETTSKCFPTKKVSGRRTNHFVYIPAYIQTRIPGCAHNGDHSCSIHINLLELSNFKSSNLCLSGTGNKRGQMLSQTHTHIRIICSYGPLNICNQNLSASYYATTRRNAQDRKPASF